MPISRERAWRQRDSAGPDGELTVRDAAMTPGWDEVGAVFRRLREAQGLTQTELADQAQVSRANLTNMENGRNPASWLTLGRLSVVLGTTISGILREAELTTRLGPASQRHLSRPRRSESVALGPVLRERREAAGLSVAEIAILMCVDRAFISRAEEGTISIDWDTMTKFADALETRVGFIVLDAERQTGYNEQHRNDGSGAIPPGNFPSAHALGATLRAVRLERQMTVVAVAQAAGVTRKTIVERETGSTSPKLAGLYAMARALGYAGSDLVTRAEAEEAEARR